MLGFAPQAQEGVCNSASDQPLARDGVRPDTPRRLDRRQAWLLQKRIRPVGASGRRSDLPAMASGLIPRDASIAGKPGSYRIGSVAVSVDRHRRGLRQNHHAGHHRHRRHDHRRRHPAERTSSSPTGTTTRRSRPPLLQLDSTSSLHSLSGREPQVSRRFRQRLRDIEQRMKVKNG